jgi:hypothetical protein
MTELPRAAAARSLGVRFLIAYFVLYAFPFPLGAFPLTDKLAELVGRVIDAIVLAVGAHVLGIDVPRTSAT